MFNDVMIKRSNGRRVKELLDGRLVELLRRIDEVVGAEVEEDRLIFEVARGATILEAHGTPRSKPAGIGNSPSRGQQKAKTRLRPDKFIDRPPGQAGDEHGQGDAA